MKEIRVYESGFGTGIKAGSKVPFVLKLPIISWFYGKIFEYYLDKMLKKAWKEL